jgi:DNA invertase Pin-like site-specific DNA recombinase
MNTKPTTSSSRLVGYARVSTGQQDLQLQLDALKVAGVSKANLYTDKISGSKAARP